MDYTELIETIRTYTPMGFYITEEDGCGISSPCFLSTFAVPQLLQAELEFF